MLNDREKEKETKMGENANAEPVALVALPGETLVAWSCLLLRADIYIESGTYLQSILKRTRGSLRNGDENRRS